jgi:hypothetical protein
MKTYNQFINESIRDKMVGKSKQDVLDNLSTISISDHIDAVRSNNMGISYLPSKQEILDTFFYVGDHPLKIDDEKIYDTNNKIIKNVYDELFHTQYNMTYHKLQKVFIHKLDRKYITDMIKFWFEDMNVNKETVLNILSNDDVISVIDEFHKVVNEIDYNPKESIISDLIKYYDEDKFREISKEVITNKTGLPDDYLDE